MKQNNEQKKNGTLFALNFAVTDSVILNDIVRLSIDRNKKNKKHNDGIMQNKKECIRLFRSMI